VDYNWDQKPSLVSCFCIKKETKWSFFLLNKKLLKIVFIPVAHLPTIECPTEREKKKNIFQKSFYFISNILMNISFYYFWLLFPLFTKKKENLFVLIVQDYLRYKKSTFLRNRKTNIFFLFISSNYYRKRNVLWNNPILLLTSYYHAYSLIHFMKHKKFSWE